MALMVVLIIMLFYLCQIQLLLVHHKFRGDESFFIMLVLVFIA